MHIEKNVFDNLFNTVMNDSTKTKDNEKARLNLPLNCLRRDFELRPLPNGKMTKPKAKILLTSEEEKLSVDGIRN